MYTHFTSAFFYWTTSLVCSLKRELKSTAILFSGVLPVYWHFLSGFHQFKYQCIQSKWISPDTKFRQRSAFCFPICILGFRGTYFAMIIFEFDIAENTDNCIQYLIYSSTYSLVLINSKEYTAATMYDLKFIDIRVSKKRQQVQSNGIFWLFWGICDSDAHSSFVQFHN